MATEAKTTGAHSPTRPDYQRAAERSGAPDVAGRDPDHRRDLGDKLADKADEAARKAREAGDTLKDKADEAGDTIKDKASEVAHTVQEAGHNLAEKSKSGHETICKFTKENPTVAVLIAFGAGAILARILPKW